MSSTRTNAPYVTTRQVHSGPFHGDELQRLGVLDLRRFRHTDREDKRLGVSGVAPCL